jgi:hypothetical protein
VSNEGCALLASLNIPECAEILRNECHVGQGETPTIIGVIFKEE